MNRKIFMERLEQLLQDIQENERVEALQYYEDYFEEAGEENEQQVLIDIGTPEKVAAIIKTSLLENSNETGEFTENGYADPRFVINYEVANKENDKDYSDNQYDNAAKGTAPHRERKYVKEDSEKNIALIIILCILAIPVGLPLLGGAVGAVFGVVGVVIGILAAAAALAIGLTIGGIAVFVIGLFSIFTTPPLGIVSLGVGLILLGVGVLFVLLTVMICGKLIPWLVRGFVSLCSIPFRRKGRV